jgi:2-polyprenyl-3-methyl-5-hydroxy-6-metoxy-1,4-benzoquinol methylase
MSAIQQWKAMIKAEHDQSERMRASAPPHDHWQDYAHRFRVDPYRSGDALLDRLRQEVEPRHTVIDVGAGGGRLALPLALQCQQVVAVEPSPSMASVLLQQAAEYGIDNLSLIQARWEEAEVAQGDIAMCVHALYTIQDVGPFVRKLAAHAREKVLIVLHKAAPQSQIYPLWKEVHQEKRLPLPALPQLEKVLEELGIAHQVELLAPQPPWGFDSLEQAIEKLARRLYLAPGSPKKARLMEMLPEKLEQVEGLFRIRDAQLMEPALVWWRTGIK